MIKTSEIDIATIELLPGNIFNVTVRAGAEIDLEAAKRFVHVTNQMLPKDVKFRAGIYDISKITYIHDEARKYFATTDDITGTVAGSAIISSTFLGRTIGNLFLALSGPRKFPIKMFDSPMSAEHWVRTRLKELRDADEQRESAVSKDRKVA